MQLRGDRLAGLRLCGAFLRARRGAGTDGFSSLVGGRAGGRHGESEGEGLPALPGVGAGTGHLVAGPPAPEESREPRHRARGAWALEKPGERTQESSRDCPWRPARGREEPEEFLEAAGLCPVSQSA